MASTTKNILLPIDSYADSERVFKDVLPYLHGSEGEFKIFLLKTYLVSRSPLNRIINTHDELRDQSLERLRQELQTAQKLSQGKKVQFETVAQIGSPANVILRFVEEKNIDCVILGRDGAIKQEDIAPLLSQVQCQVVVLPSGLFKK